MNLAGEWRLTGAGHDVAMPLPGDGISALVAAGVLPDPYFGANELACRWVCAAEWTVARSFDHPGGDAVLVIAELDGVAEVRVNGLVVLEASNSFRHWRVPVVARAGTNDIAITFRPVLEEGARRQAALPFPVPWHQGNCPLPNGNMLRKQACDFGWDWNIALAPFGVYGEITVEVAQAPRPIDIWLRQVHASGRVTVVLQAATHVAGKTPFKVEVAGVVVTGVSNPEGVIHTELVIENPDLWWPAGQGAQMLHDLTLTVGDRIERRRIGFRDIALDSQPDTAGRSFGFVVNGRSVFAKGANWIPADALAGRIDRDAVRDLLQSAVDVHMNMIRVWGGGRYEPDWFYDLCDEMGLMVWQDAMLSCHLYPSTPDFLAEVGTEVAEQVLRLHHHASLALWCGDNELIGALTWYPESKRDRDRYLVSYDRLNRTVEDAVATVPGQNWWPSSPSPGPLSFGDAWHDDKSGDMHMWSVWHEGRDFDHYRDVRPRFCSEFGFQSYPSMEVIRRFAAPEDWNIASPVMEAHQKNAGGNARIAETMFRYFRFPVTFPDFVWLSQIQQGLAIKTAVTAWRGLKPHCQGTLYWQLNDTWPCCSWSSLDHGGGWKLLHHMARGFYAPVTVVALPKGDAVRLVGVNDTPGAVGIAVTAFALAMDGTRRAIARGEGDVAAEAVALATIPLGDLRAGEILHWDWDAAPAGSPPTPSLPHGGGGSRPAPAPGPDAGPSRDARSDSAPLPPRLEGMRWGGDPWSGSDHWAPVPWKALPVVDPQARMEVRPDGPVWRVTLTTHALAPFATVEADLPGRFDDNAVMLIPGRPVTLTFTPQAPGTPAFTLRHLHSATHGA